MLRLKILGGVFAALLFLVGPVEAAKEEGSVLRRMTLMVHDVEVSIAFYRDVLGFTVWFRTEGNVGAEGLPTSDAAPGDPTDFAIMKGRHPYIGMIGLLQYGKKRPPPGPDADRRIHAGKQILMIEVDDLDGAIAKMKARGDIIHRDVFEGHINSVDEEWDAKFSYVYDPDGNFIELTERLN